MLTSDQILHHAFLPLVPLEGKKREGPEFHHSVFRVIEVGKVVDKGVKKKDQNLYPMTVSPFFLLLLITKLKRLKQSPFPPQGTLA